MDAFKINFCYNQIFILNKKKSFLYIAHSLIKKTKIDYFLL